MLKILQARLQQYMNWELPDVQAGFKKVRGTRDQIANICWIIEKARKFQKSIYFCFINLVKAFVEIIKKLWKILRDRNTRPPYLPPEKPVCRSRSKLEPELKTGKGICQGWILSFCLFYAEYLMKNVRPDDHKLESRLPVEILTTSDTILMAESKEELISLLKTVKEESTEASFKLNIQKTKIVTSSPTVP